MDLTYYLIYFLNERKSEKEMNNIYKFVNHSLEIRL